MFLRGIVSASAGRPVEKSLPAAKSVIREGSTRESDRLPALARNWRAGGDGDLNAAGATAARKEVGRERGAE
jgi:hypothetical protein